MPDPITLAAGPLHLLFVREGDRWRHDLLLGSPENPALLLGSVERGENPQWPPSPPVQHLQLQEGGQSDAHGHSVVLGVGSAAAYWSFSAATIPDATGIEFDIACRTGLDPGPLQTTYRVVPPTRATAMGDQILLVRATGETRLVPLDGTRIAVGGTTLALMPPVPPASDREATRRWRYRILHAPRNA